MKAQRLTIAIAAYRCCILDQQKIFALCLSARAHKSALLHFLNANLGIMQKPVEPHLTGSATTDFTHTGAANLNKASKQLCASFFKRKSPKYPRSIASTMMSCHANYQSRQHNRLKPEMCEHGRLKAGMTISKRLVGWASNPTYWRVPSRSNDGSSCPIP